MPPLDPDAIHVVVRWSHLVAMAAALGGSLLVTVIVFSRRDGSGSLVVAQAYERLFWAAGGILVMPGVGNLGGFGRALQAPGTEWGTTLMVKLFAVAALLAVSLMRSLAVQQLARSGVVGASVRGALRGVYGVSLGLLAAIVLAAEMLAHSAGPSARSILPRSRSRSSCSYIHAADSATSCPA